MGVPGLFAWLRRKYPLIVDENATTSGTQQIEHEEDDRVCHNLYIGQRPWLMQMLIYSIAAVVRHLRLRRGHRMIT